MASPTETVIWPMAIVLGISFAIMTMIMLSQAERDVTFHTTEQLSHTAARSTLYTFLNSQRKANGEKMSAYTAMSLCWSNRKLDGGDVMDRGIINDRTASIDPPQPRLLQYIKVEGTGPGGLLGGKECTKSGDAMKTLGERGKKGADMAQGGIHTYEVKVPKSGGDLQTVTMWYAAKVGVIEN